MYVCVRFLVFLSPATHAPTMATQASPVTTEAPPILKSTETISQSLDQEIIDLCGVVTATTEPDDSVKTVSSHTPTHVLLFCCL